MMSKTSLRRFAVSIICVFFLIMYFNVTVSEAATDVLQDFSTADSLTANFNDGNASPIFTWNANGGLAGGGGINIPLGTNEIWTTKQGYTLAPDGVYTVSAYFKILENSGYGGLGFVISSSNMPGTTTAGPNNPNLGMAFHGGGGSFINNQTEVNVNWPPDLVLGNWYKMIYQVTAKGGGVYDIKFQIWNSDANGVLGTMKTEQTYTFTNNEVYNASTLHVYFAAAGSRMGAIDDFRIQLDGSAVLVEPGPPAITSNGGGATAAISIPENTTDVTTVTAIDLDAGATITYSISGGADAAKFTINPSTGVLTFVSAPDFENPTDVGSNNTYEVIVQATDNTSKSDTQTITVTVADVFEVQPTWAGTYPKAGTVDATSAQMLVQADMNGNAYFVALPSGAAAPTAAQVKAGTDASDVALAANMKGTVALTANTEASFSATGLTSNTTYDIYVVAEDNMPNLQVTPTKLTVTTSNNAPTDISLDSTSVAENLSSGTTVGTLSALDPDLGDTATFTLVNGTGDTDNNSFSIIGTSLKTAASFDYETKSSYSIRLRVSDGGGLTYEKTFTISVTDGNDPPTLDAITGITITEDDPEQTVNLTGIGTGAANETQTLTVTATSDNTALIPNPTVNYTSPNATGTLTFTPIADANGTATITVTVDDGQGANNTVSKTYTVTVSAVNDIPTVGNSTVNGTEGITLTFAATNFTTNFSDVDNDSLNKIQIVTLPTNGTLKVNGTAANAGDEVLAANLGTITFEPTVGWSGSTTFTWKGFDGAEYSNIAEITINIAMSDITAVATDKAALNIIFGGSDNTASVTRNITLPTSGTNGTTISWSSNNAEVISNTGVVTRPSYSTGDKLVTLTATITKGSESVTKTFDLVVTKLPAPVSDAPVEETTDEVEVVVNGEQQNQAATVKTEKIDETTVTTVVLDTEKIIVSIKEKEAGSTIVIPVVNKEANVVRGELTGELVKAMEEKRAIVEVQTEKATYTLPAEEIKIETVAKEIGENILLKDIKISVEISETMEQDVIVMDNAAKDGGMEIVVPPVSFKVKATYGDKEIEVKQFNNYVERLIAIPEGVDPSKITTGVVMNPDGTVSHVPTQVIIKDGKYYAKINSLTNSNYSVIWNPKEYTDVANHWAKEAVNDMGSRLVISGYDKDTFKPDQDITRAEYVAIVVKALGLRNPNTEAQFTDVNKNSWYYEQITLAYEYKLINGYEDRTFRPDKKITREEAMTIIGRAMNIAGMDTEISQDQIMQQLNNFTDSKEIDDWAKKAAALGINNGIVNGYDGKLTPKANITRAETAAMIRRVLQKANLI